MKLITVNYKDIVVSDLVTGAIIRNDFPGFKEDYLTVHCLIKKYQPTTLLEIGTSSGSGTKVICNAMGIKRYFWNKNKNLRKVISIDVPPKTDPSIMYPEGEDGHPKKAGRKCNYPYTQLFGNSKDFDFSPYYPIDAWFIDGKHNYEYAKGDTLQALKSDPQLLMWHDIQLKEVLNAVKDTLNESNKYDLYVVEGTRIAYAVKTS